LSASGPRLEKRNANASARRELRAERRRPDGARLGAALFLLVALGGIGALVLDLNFGGPLSAVEQRVAAAIDYHAFPELVPLMLALSYLGSNTFVGFVAAIFALFLYWQSRRGDALLLLIAVYGALLLNPALKQFFQRARPLMEDPVLVLQTYAFPSGHAVSATVLYCALAILVARRNPSLRLLAMTAAALLTAIVGASRVYLGVHYVSDVLAGVLVGIAWLMLCHRAISSVRERRA
jgi:membrane-associated phospholipid phosphatase